MKSITRITLLLGLIITTISCSIDNRDPYVEYNHGFTTDVFTPEKALLLQETPFKLQMNPNVGEIIDLGYTMEYRVTKGEGYFKTLKDSVIDKAKPFEIETDSLKREQEFIFIPTTKDQVTIAMKVWDTYGGEQEFEVNYTVENPPFTVSLTPETTTPLEKTTISINLDLVPQEESDMQYQVKLNTLSDLGAITTQEGTTLVADKWYPITVGTNLWQFEALNIGEYPLSITVKDEFEQEVTQRVPLTIKGINFALKATAAEPTIFETATTSMTLNLSQDITEVTLPYEVRLNTVSNVGTLQFANGTTMNATEWYDLPLGDTALRFTSTTDGVYNADFTVRIKGQPERTDTASGTITVKKTEFKLSLTTDKSNFTTRDDDFVKLTFQPTLVGFRKDLIYTLSFDSSRSGSVVKKADIPSSQNPAILAGQETNIPNIHFQKNTNFDFFYLANDEGIHNVDITITASNGFSETVSFIIDAYKVPEITSVRTGGIGNNYYISITSANYDSSVTIQTPLEIEVEYFDDGLRRIEKRVMDYDTAERRIINGIEYRRWILKGDRNTVDPLQQNGRLIAIRLTDRNMRTGSRMLHTFTTSFTDNQ